MTRLNTKIRAAGAWSIGPADPAAEPGFDHWLEGKLREIYRADIDEPLPADMTRLLRLLDDRE